jgi:hypothetical protein
MKRRAGGNACVTWSSVKAGSPADGVSRKGATFAAQAG